MRNDLAGNTCDDAVRLWSAYFAPANPSCLCCHTMNCRPVDWRWVIWESLQRYVRELGIAVVVSVQHAAQHATAHIGSVTQHSAVRLQCVESVMHNSCTLSTAQISLILFTRLDCAHHAALPCAPANTMQLELTSSSPVSHTLLHGLLSLCVRVVVAPCRALGRPGGCHQMHRARS